MSLIDRRAFLASLPLFVGGAALLRSDGTPLAIEGCDWLAPGSVLTKQGHEYAYVVVAVTDAGLELEHHPETGNY